MAFKHPPSPRPPEAPAPRPRPPEEAVDSGTKEKGGIGRAGWIVLGIIGISLTGLLLRSIIARRHQDTEIKAAAKVEAVSPSVQFITPHRAPATTDLVLPGSVLAGHQTTVYARSTGYLRRWLVDIGDRVKAGQVLAEIESPEVDQQLSQAQADLAKAQANAKQAQADLAKSQANLVQNRASLAKGVSDLAQVKANLEIARQTWQRWQALVQQGAVTQQAADEKLAAYKANLASVSSAENTIGVDQANVKAAEESVSSSQANLEAFIANVRSSEANLKRNAALQSFQKVTAPFAGVITARNVDSGGLITAGNGSNNTSNGSNNTSLYTIAAYDILNVDVKVPQSNVQSIQLGQTAQIKVRELPQRVFMGKVVRTSDTLDPSTQTMQTRMEVQNQDYAMRPGISTEVTFPFNRANPPLMVPDNTLVTNAGGTQVAIVTNNQTVHYQKVETGRDNGIQSEIRSGLQGNERLIVNPTTNLVEGMRVQAHAAKQQKPT